MNSYILIWLLMLSYVLLNNTIVKCGISARSKSVVSGCLLGLMFLTLWIVIGFREYGTSGDYATYEITWFNQIRKYDLLSLVRSYLWKRDIGFVFLLWIGSCFFDTYRPVFVVIVFLLLLGICASYKRFKVSPIEGLFVLFSLTGFTLFTTTRQGIAFVILLFGMKHLEENRIKKWIIYVFVAGLFHSSAWFLFILFFIYKIKLSTKNLLMWGVIGAVAFAFSKVISSVLILVWRDGVYDELGTSSSGKGYLLTLFLLLMILMIYFFTLHCKTGINQNAVFSVNMSVVAVIIYAVSTQSEIFRRLALYFMPFFSVALNLRVPFGKALSGKICYGAFRYVLLICAYGYLCKQWGEFQLIM